MLVLFIRRKKNMKRMKNGMQKQTKMKKRIITMKNLILVAVLLLTVSALSFAQTSTANILANVNATLSVSNLTNLTIGNVNQGATVTIASNVAAAASFLVTGAASSATAVTVTFPTELTSGGNTMPFTGQIPRWNTVAGAGTSTAFGALAGGTTPTNGTGNLWVYVGGGVTAGASQAVGSYGGTITVGVTQP
jgi:Tfp pilus assembly protein PilV